MPHEPPIPEAMADLALFGQTFAAPSWSGWGVFLAALSGMPLSGDALALFQRCTGRTVPRTEQAREAWLVCGRRSGKSLITAFLVVYFATLRDWRPHLGPGDVATIMAIAGDRRQARTIMRYVSGLLEASPVLSQEILSQNQERIELRRRVNIEIHSGSFRSVRGYAIPIAILDEVAFFRAEGSALPADELVRALEPSLGSLPGSLLIGLSSPHSRRGILWERYRQHYGKDGSDVLIWQADSLTMNPTLRSAAIERAYANDHESAAAEWGGLFRTDVSQFLADDLIDVAVTDECAERAPVLYLSDGTPVSYRAFCDPSGGRHDAMTLAIAHDAHGHAVLDCLRVVLPPFDPQRVVADFARVLKQYRLASVTGDKYGAEWVASQFATHGVSYLPASLDKSSVYIETLPRFSQRAVTLLDHARLLTELRLLERRPRSGGRPDLIDHPPQQSDDTANAALGAIWLTGADAGRELDLSMLEGFPYKIFGGNSMLSPPMDTGSRILELNHLTNWRR